MSDQVAKPWLPFEELVQSHWNWRRDASAEPAYRETLGAFERECGTIVDSYWCETVPAAVALTERPRRARRPELRFHRVTDWATKNEPEIAALLHACDELTIKVARILHGPTRAIAMRLVVSSATHLLSLVDGAAEHRRTADRDRAIVLERRQLEDAAHYYDEVGLRQAQLVYLRGMIVGALLIAAVAGGVWAVSGRDFSNRIVLAIALGAVGAVLSVMDRMSSRKAKFQLDYELGKAPLVVFGLFRPLLGAGFGLVVYTALASKFVNIDLAGDPTTKTSFYALLSFAAGWSERLAKDVLDAAETTVGASVKARRATTTAAQGKAAAVQAAAEPGQAALGAGGSP
jgi:hypothetical protein